MFEELSEDGKLTEEAAIEIHELQDFIDCLFVMDALAQSMLLWLEQFRNRRHFSITFRDIRLIRLNTRTVKHRMRAAYMEVFGSHAGTAAEKRDALLCAKIMDALESMRVFKKE